MRVQWMRPLLLFLSRQPNSALASVVFVFKVLCSPGAITAQCNTVDARRNKQTLIVPSLHAAHSCTWKSLWKDYIACHMHYMTCERVVELKLAHCRWSTKTSHFLKCNTFSSKKGEHLFRQSELWFLFSQFLRSPGKMWHECKFKREWSGSCN